MAAAKTGSIAPALVGAAGNILGGLLGKKKQSVDYTHLQKGIQWKVADAKAAGIHPLYALGAQVGSPTVTTETGSSIGNAVSSAATGYARSHANKGLMAAQINAQNASAARDFALAAQTMSEVARAKVGINSQPTGTTSMMLPPSTIGHGDNTTLGSGFDVQAAEDRWWEFGGAAAGILNVGGDLAEMFGKGLAKEYVDNKMRKLDAKRQHQGRARRGYVRPKTKAFKYSYQPTRKQRL